MIVSIRADSGPLVGYGHVMRCLAVAQALKKKRTVDARFLMSQDSDAQAVIAEGFDIVRLPEDGTETGKLMTVVKPDDGPMLLDTYTLQQRDLQDLRAAGYQVALFDDGCRLGTYSCNAVIDSAPAAAELPYQSDVGTAFYLGSDYFSLREEFSNCDTRRSVLPSFKNIVVSFGGSDEDDATSFALTALTKIKGDFRICAILGPGYTGAAETVAKHDRRIRISRNVGNMADVFAAAELAVSSSGGTASELAFLGVPAALISLSVDQVPVAMALDSVGAGIYVGSFDAIDSERLIGTVQTLINEPEQRQKMSDIGRGLVDGQGAYRIAEIVNSLHWNSGQ